VRRVVDKPSEDAAKMVPLEKGYKKEAWLSGMAS